MTISVANENSPLLPVTSTHTRELSLISFRIILSCLYANVFLGAVDSTMVATLLGKMASDLDAQEQISWVATSYLLSCAAFQPLFGKISDVFGRKPVILFSCFSFFIGCLISGVGNTVLTLVIGRLIAGIGGGGFFSLATITISDLVDTRERGLYQGYLNVFFHAGSASGGILGGIVDSYLGWKWAFLLQVPVAAATGLAVYHWFDLPGQNENDNDNEKTHWEKFKALDWFGAFLLVTALLALMIISGTSSDDLPFASPLWVCLAIYSLIGFVSFYFWEQKVPEPVIPVKLLHNQTILASSLNCWFVCMNMFASLFYLPFYWNSVKNISPLYCGYRLISGSIVASFTSIFAGFVIKKTSKYRILHLGAAAGIIIGTLLLYSSSKTDGWLKDTLIALPLRYGCSADITIILIAMISAVPNSQQALVTSIQYGFRSTGSTMGVSFANALMQFILSSKLKENFKQLKNVELPDGWTWELLKKARKQALQDPSYAFDSQTPEVIRNAIVSSYDTSCHGVFLFLIITGVLSVICIYFTEENDLDNSKK